MKFKYCPNCAGISTMRPHEGLFKCSRCNFVGKPEEGTAEQINVLSRRVKSGTNPLTAAQTAIQPKGDARTMDAIKESALKPDSERPQHSIAVDERLRKLKGKKSDNFEFL